MKAASPWPDVAARGVFTPTLGFLDVPILTHGEKSCSSALGLGPRPDCWLMKPAKAAVRPGE